LFIDVDEEQNARIETWLVLDNISGLSSTMALPFEVGRSLLGSIPPAVQQLLWMGEFNQRENPVTVIEHISAVSCH
jgi:hypothetical protein